MMQGLAEIFGLIASNKFDCSTLMIRHSPWWLIASMVENVQFML